MKYIMFIALSLFSLMASANGENTPTTPQPIAQTYQYDYTQDLDIAKIVRISSSSNAATECGPVTARMVYIDSKGVTHNLQYIRLGNGCHDG